jgi:hypothetical protein
VAGQTQTMLRTVVQGPEIYDCSANLVSGMKETTGCSKEKGMIYVQ